MTRIIAIANQKGGVAKTTTAVNLAAALALAGHATLLVDMDPQSNATLALLGAVEPEATTYDLIVNEESLAAVTLPTGTLGLSIVPSDILLSAADLHLAQALGREKRLKRRLQDPPYDYVIIDTPPSLGILTVNSLTAANEIIIPVSMSFFALKGIQLFLDTVEQVRTNLDHPSLRLTGVVCTFYDPRTNVSKDTVRIVQEYFGPLVFRTQVPVNVALEVAHSAGKTVFEYDPASSGAKAYAALTEEVIRRGQEIRAPQQPALHAHSQA
jgi:chromosome partitioning protein